MGDRLDQALANNIQGNSSLTPLMILVPRPKTSIWRPKWTSQTKRIEFDRTVAELSSHFGSHSYNLVRYILKISKSGLRKQ